MVLLKGLVITSLLVLGLSYYLHKNIDTNGKAEIALRIYIGTVNILSTIDFHLHSMGFKGVYRKLERVISDVHFKFLNTSGVKIELAVFDGVEVVIFDPIGDSIKRPAIIYFHGGGWCKHNPKVFGPFTAELARRMNYIVISVNYRKAPEHVYPGGFKDALAAAEYVFQNAGSMGRLRLVDNDRISLMGDSAGANLALAVSHHMTHIRHQPGHSKAPLPKLIVLLSPMLQIVDLNLPSYRDNRRDPIISIDSVADHICSYILGYKTRSKCAELVASNSHIDEQTLAKIKPNIDWSIHLKGKGYDGRPASKRGQLPASEPHESASIISRLSSMAMDPAVSPLSALSDLELQQLPTMVIVAGALDPVRDDAKILHSRLRTVGRPTVYLELTEGHHDPFPFLHIGLSAANRAVDTIVRMFHQNALL